MTHILLTNDDGIQAPGLRALLEALRPLGRLSVFAPDHNWSAAGHTKTMHKPLRVARYPFPDLEGGDVEAYTSTGAPSDCVALALLGLLPDRPDIVVSGINQGANLGHDVTYSGTVAAAIEAAIFGLPAVAISLDSYESQEFGVAARVAAGVVARVQEHGLPPGTLLNVNVPPLGSDKLAGVAITRMGRRVYRDVLVERKDPRQRPYYWIGGEPPSGHLDEGTDIWAVSQGYVSITPIHLDMTAHELIPRLEAWSLREILTR
ncbi:MAG: 5'/3'-nucleotidase SurE [Chloroflexi bacterium]|nr:MAG: 5'/3'-nucleotidase SurE [Chloroflexota bacterium]